MPLSRLLDEVLMLHPQMLKGRAGGCGTWLFGAKNITASIFVRLKLGNAVPDTFLR